MTSFDIVMATDFDVTVTSIYSRKGAAELRYVTQSGKGDGKGDRAHPGNDLPFCSKTFPQLSDNSATLLPTDFFIVMYRTRRRKVLFFSSILLFTIAVVILKSRKRRDDGIGDEPTSMDNIFLFSNKSILDLNRQAKDGLNVAVWEDICGSEMLSLKEYPLFPHGPSTRLRTSSLRMHFASEFENFGLRIFGFLSPYESGNYNFYLASTGSSELWISLDSKPGNSNLIANVTSGLTWKNGRSTIPLLTGKRYYLEILHKHGLHDKDKLNFLRLKWKSSSWSEHELRDIPSNVLSPFEDDRDLEKIKSISLPSQKLQVNDGDVLPMHIKHRDPSFVNDEVKRRSEMYRLPFISEEITRDLFPPCQYNPSYIVKKPLQRYQATWETHYTAIYPSDRSDIVQRLGKGYFVNFGNDQMDENTAMGIVSQVWMKIQTKHPG